MLSFLIGTDLDEKVQAHDHIPAFRVLWFSRWQDTDSDIVRGTHKQTPIDLTDFITNGSLNLDSKSDASSVSLTIALKELPIGIFYNCIVKVYEGDARISQDDWPNTFTGWHVGQPGATEGLQNKVIDINESQTSRGTLPTVGLTFVSREGQYTSREMTSDGSWYPNVKKQPLGDTPSYPNRDLYDDIGSIARELATDTDWGMGLENDEVLIGPLPYRIEKKLQFVQVSPFEALRTLVEVLHLLPQFNGEGKLRFISRRIDGTASRSYSGIQIANASMSATAFNTINSVTAIGMDREVSKVIKPFQRMASIEGTCGFFDPDVEFRETWSEDKQDSFLVLVGSGLEDGNGNVHTSPQIRNMQRDFRAFGGGSTFFIENPKFTKATNLRYEIVVENNTAPAIAFLIALFASYVGLKSAAASIQDDTMAEVQVWETATTAYAVSHIHPGVGAPPIPPLIPIVPPPTGTAWGASTALEILAESVLLGGIMVIQQIGNFSFEVWAIPYEPVYLELRAEVVLEHFGSKFAGQPFRQHERREVEIKNYIISSKDDSVVAAGPNAGQLSVTNPGLLTFAERELAIRMAEQTVRSISLKRDILLEPGDIFIDEDTGFRYKVKAITRDIGRGILPMMSASVFRIA